MTNQATTALIVILAIGFPVALSISGPLFRKHKTPSAVQSVHKQLPQSRKKQRNKKPDPAIIEALYTQADAELSHAIALENKAKKENDPVKQTSLLKRAASSRTKSNQLSFKAYTLEFPE